jgi:hypothetical protein
MSGAWVHRIMSKTAFPTIHDSILEHVTGGVRRDPQVGFNGAIVGGDRIPKVVHTPQVGFNGAIVGGQRWPQ